MMASGELSLVQSDLEPPRVHSERGKEEKGKGRGRKGDGEKLGHKHMCAHAHTYTEAFTFNPFYGNETEAVS